MANPKIQAILGIDNKQFITEIQKSRQQLENFEKIGRKVGSALKTFTIALVGIETASQTFNKVIRSSQGISDEYDKVMRAATTTVDEFFTALSTGDFTSFQMGLNGIITKAREAQAAIDKLGNATMSYSYFDSKYSAELEDAINKAKDLKLSKADRDAAKKTAETLIGKQEEITKELSKSINNALSNVMTEGNQLNAASVGKVDLEEILLLDITAKGEENKKKLENLYKEYQAIAIKNKQKFTSYSMIDAGDGKIITTSQFDQASYDDAMKPINNQYKQAILYNEILVKKGDDWLKSTIQMAQQLDGSNRKLTEMKNKMLELSNQDVNANLKTTTNTTVSVKAEFEKGSLGYLEQQINDLKLQFKYATDITSRNKIQKEIDELTNQKRYIELEYKLSQPLKQSTTSFASMVEMPDFKNLKIESPFKKNDINVNYQYVESLNAIANVMGSVSNMTSEGAAAWLSWAANVMTAVAQAIPAITTLVAAKTAEGAASAGAEAAKTPLVGWLLVGGAIATALAAFASIPSFADGGIFQSYLTTGDKNLARLNGGEMILNKGQQANLFNLLDNGVTPMRNANVKFEIEGKKLVGVINNYNNKRSKVL